MLVGQLHAISDTCNQINFTRSCIITKKQKKNKIMITTCFSPMATLSMSKSVSFQWTCMKIPWIRFIFLASQNNSSSSSFIFPPDIRWVTTDSFIQHCSRPDLLGVVLFTIIDCRPLRRNGSFKGHTVGWRLMFSVSLLFEMPANTNRWLPVLPQNKSIIWFLNSSARC